MDPKELARDLWGTLLLRGVLAVLFGIAAVFWPALTLVTLVYLFSAYVVVTGVVNVVQGVMSMKSPMMWYLTLVIGLVELGVGVYLLRHTDVSFATLILLIGFTLVIRGVLEVVAAFMDMGGWGLDADVADDRWAGLGAGWRDCADAASCRRCCLCLGTGRLCASGRCHDGSRCTGRAQTDRRQTLESVA